MIQPYVCAKDLLAGMTIKWNEGRLERKPRRALVLSVEYTKSSRLIAEFIHVEEDVRVQLLREDGTTTTTHFQPSVAIDQMAPITMPEKAQDENNG